MSSTSISSSSSSSSLSSSSSSSSLSSSSSSSSSNSLCVCPAGIKSLSLELISDSCEQCSFSIKLSSSSSSIGLSTWNQFESIYRGVNDGNSGETIPTIIALNTSSSDKRFEDFSNNFFLNFENKMF